MGSYIPGTKQEQKEMLAEIGFESMEELFGHIPDEVKVKDGLQIPDGMSELEVRSPSRFYIIAYMAIQKETVRITPSVPFWVLSFYYAFFF